ncbi:GNAT family N-acetyltransferase (plasmid) [Burkholderia thailandensis]|uniref:arsenic resistance N-acetyltransferase ArsN2 n=1 Tax=Burkholderia thailandensis TaxID=57975 RepID=UPI00192E1B24|nr:arsenic resistance N-acetyltransferase ArsN2 [Burkholderia thailandensis]MBS2132293.1 GNAT family N-acetyltransferase [Burkholderia thailandensis]QRA15381.1 GNAT family N-acetyltransferase [Burkholderia thailandensis]
MIAYVIRPAHREEYPVICAMLATESLPSEDVTVDQIPQVYVAVSDVDDGLLGSVAFAQYGADALLRSLAVTPGARRNGIGIALVNKAQREAADRAVRRLFLLTTTATTFFSAMGYRVVERGAAPGSLQATSQFASLCPASAVCMMKELSGQPSQ